MASDIDGFDLVDPQSYTSGAPHDTWRRLRAKSPVHRCEPPGYRPFWAITKHADIAEVSKQPDKFLSSPGIILLPEAREQIIERDGGAFDQMETIIQMDPPKHRTFRKVGSPWFTPNAVKQLDARNAQAQRDRLDACVARALRRCEGAHGRYDCFWDPIEPNGYIRNDAKSAL